MTLTDELPDTGYPNSLRPDLHKALKARGIDYWVAQGITFWNRDDGCECLAYGYKANGVPKLAVKVVGFTDPEQAIAATVGRTVWEPSKEWKAWHESLRHDNPSNVREAVENILFDAIDFGGDMGPNGNVWSGVDEGDVLTEKCIDGWVRSIESTVAMVGVESIECEPDGWYKCPKCGCVVGYDELYGGGWAIVMDDYQIPFNCCPNCGRMVAE